MYPYFHDNRRTTHPLDRSPIVRNREHITNSCNHIFVNNIRCKGGTALKLLVQNEQPSCPHSFQIDISSNETYVLHAFSVAIWSVGNEHHCSPSAENALNTEALSAQRRAIISSLSTAPPPVPDTENVISGVIPGDLCTLLSSGQEDTDLFPVIVHRYWKNADDMPSVTLLWLRTHSPIYDPTRPDIFSLEYLAAHIVENIDVDTDPSISPSPTNHDQVSHHVAGASSCGTLLDGMPLVIYRILLYCDDFQKSSAMYPSGSAGGCYVLPMSLPPEARRNTSSVRLISLTPTSVSTNKVLHYITDDLVNASVRGVRGYTPTGEPVKIFIDVVGFVGDYPASSSVVDVVGLVGSNPCTLCSFRRLEKEGTEGSRYGFTTDVHANNSAFMRHGERHDSLRGSGISDEDAKLLGMVAEEKYSDTTCPLLYLQRKMKAMESRPALTSDGVPVVSNTFDAFRCNVIAPGHLLTGLSKNVLHAMFKSLPTKELRMKSDAYICSGLNENGRLRQKQVFNMRKPTLPSMTLSELFCVLLVSVPAFRVRIRQYPSDHITQDCYRLVKRLQRLIALTYWCPLRELDGEDAVNLVHGDKDSYFSDLKTLSKQYVKEVDKVCVASDMAKEQLDKPNLHRLIDLYEHTMPAYGHVREIMELVFESAHQPLKRCTSRSNNHNAHIFAVEHCVGNDWQGRLAALTRAVSHSDEQKRKAARRGLRGILVGEQADLLDEQRHSELIEEIDPMLEELFTPALRRLFQKDNMISNLSVGKSSVWRARGRKKVDYICKAINVGEREGNKILHLSTRWIRAIYPVIPDLGGNSDDGNDDIRLFAKARRVKVSESGRQIGKPSGFDTISAESCLQNL